MPQPVMTKYKQGDLGADYPKDKPKGKKLDLSIHSNRETRPDTFPTKTGSRVEPSFNKMADERDY